MTNPPRRPIVRTFDPAKADPATLRYLERIHAANRDRRARLLATWALGVVAYLAILVVAFATLVPR